MKRVILTSLFFAASSTVALVSANAQETSGILDEIVVTAQKREQNASDVGISVTAFSGDAVEKLGFNNTVEITEQVPGLQLNAWSPKLTIFNLRGVSQNNFTDQLEAPVAVYMDDAYIASINGISGQLFDTKRVEVLRGPQGTLFGRNATGGLIHFLSRDASADETNGYVAGSIGNYNRHEIEGAVGGALGDNARIRVAGRYAKAGGYIESTDGPGPLPESGQDIGGEDGYAIRGNLQVDFSDQLTGSFWVKYSADNDVPTGGYVFANCTFETNGYCNVDDAGLGSGTNGVINGITGESAGPFENFGDTAGFLNREVKSYQANFNYELGNGIQLTSITNIMQLDQDYLEDGDAIPVLVINFGNSVAHDQRSQEFRLSGDNDTLNWQVGAYFLDMDISGGITTEGAPVIGAAIEAGLPGVTPLATQTYTLESKNTSIFGQIEVALSPDVAVTAGLRYSQDDKEIDYLNELSEGGTTQTGTTDEDFAADVPGINEIDYGDWAGRLSLDWNVDDNTLLFASFNRGIKGGNFTLASDISANNFRHDEEVLHSYEAGFKMQNDDGTVRVNGTAFVYDYQDYQAFALTGGTPQVTNSDASASGAEVEVFWSPTPRFDAILGTAFMASEVEEVQGAGEQFGPELFADAPDVGACENQGGFFFCDYPQDVITNTELPNAPAFSLNYLLRYNWDALSGNVAVQADGAYYDEQYLEVTNGLSSLQDAYGVTNLSASWADENGLEVQAFVKNVFEEEYAVYSLNLGILGTTQYYGAPTTYGLTLRKKW